MKRIIILLFTGLISVVGVAQELITPSYMFSHKKTAYITLKDGTEIKGNLKDVDRDKGLIEQIKIIDGSGKKHKLAPKDIKHMYLPPSGLDKLTKRMEAVTDVQGYSSEHLVSDLIAKGLAYFENSNVKIKKREEVLMMQVLNPAFCKEVKVYHDPRAKETTSFGYAGMKFAGGDAKSYYIKIGNEAAYKVSKKYYVEEFKPLWGKCKELISKFKEIEWSDLASHTLEYSKCRN